MNLPNRGFRFILRVVDGRVDGSWMHPTDIKAAWLDCTDMDDNTFHRAIARLQFCLEHNREIDHGHVAP